MAWNRYLGTWGSFELRIEERFAHLNQHRDFSSLGHEEGHASRRTTAPKVAANEIKPFCGLKSKISPVAGLMKRSPANSE